MEPPGALPGDINAGAAIVMDADTRAIIYGKNIHQQCYPASITSAYDCSARAGELQPDETVTFSDRAVTDLELERDGIHKRRKAADRGAVSLCAPPESANDVANAWRSMWQGA